jgi:pimeloyl-ACP methyl ester carboxylesterase
MAVQTAYDVQGSGPAVVLVHGLGLNRDMWQWQLDALSPHFTVVRFDLLGHGDSAKPAGPYRMQQMVEQIEALMADLAIEQAAVVGFSLGGLIAQAFALEHPDKVSALGIFNSAHARTNEQRASIMLRVRQSEESGPAATVDDALARWFSEDFADKHPDILANVRQWVTANDKSVYPALYRLLAEADIGLETSIKDIQCPTLIITGEEDFGNSPEMAKQMAAIIPHAHAEILPGLRHMALAEDPAAINSLLVPFLRDNLL